MQEINDEVKMIWIPQVISSILLLWALYPKNPYVYYIFLRWVCCASFAYLALQAHNMEKKNWVWILAVTAVVYNPLSAIHLTRAIWSIINIATVVVALSSVFGLRRSTGKTPT